MQKFMLTMAVVGIALTATAHNDQIKPLLDDNQQGEKIINTFHYRLQLQQIS